MTELVTLASRAFALFYAGQCFVAVMTALRQEAGTLSGLRVTVYTVMVLLCLITVIFGVPVQA